MENLGGQGLINVDMGEDQTAEVDQGTSKADAAQEEAGEDGPEPAWPEWELAKRHLREVEDQGEDETEAQIARIQSECLRCRIRLVAERDRDAAAALDRADGVRVRLPEDRRGVEVALQERVQHHLVAAADLVVRAQAHLLLYEARKVEASLGLLFLLHGG